MNSPLRRSAFRVNAALLFLCFSIMQANNKKARQSKKTNQKNGPGFGRSRVAAPPAPVRDDILVTAPAAQARVGGSSRPVFDTLPQSGDLRIRVRHREFIQDLNGSSAYAAISLAINPGLPSTFPWLSGVAAQFEAYRFNRLKFQYRSAVATSSAGKALLSVDYDAADSAPISKVSQMQERTKADGPVWTNFDMGCDRADLDKLPQRYIRNAAPAANLDIKTYDVGNLIFGVVGNATVALGELWAEYDVELITPNTAPGTSNGASIKIVSNTSVSTSAIFGTAPIVSTLGNIGISIAANAITFNQPGQYLVETARTGTTVVSMSAASAGGSTVALRAADTPNSAATFAVGSWSVTTTAAGQSIVFTDSDATTTAMTTRIANYTNSF